MYEFSSIVNKSNKRAASPVFEHNKKESSFGAFFQPKLTINQPNDVYEQEADSMADKVMRMSESENIHEPFFRPGISTLQRKCKHCEEEKKQVQRTGTNEGEPSALSEENYINSLSGGRSLQAGERSFFESKIGYDFSDVHLHTDATANQSAKNLNALAYTSGNNIVFGEGQYQPGTDSGKRLIAHELTHVVQQGGNISRQIQRQPEDDKKGPSSDIAKEINKNSVFQKLPKFARDKILDEIDHAPETITKAILDKIIDVSPIDDQYKEGLKKVGEEIIKRIAGIKPAAGSKCDAVAGFHEGGSKDFKGQCCTGSYDSAQTCCPKDKFAPQETNANFCCKPDEYVNQAGKCFKPDPVDITKICVAPGKKDDLGKCCFPPMEVIDGMCVNPPKPEPKEPPFSMKFTMGVIDDYNIDESIINSRQKTHFDEVKKQIHQFMEACPASMITVTGFADKPGTEEHNSDLGQRRADHVKFLLQLDLLKINFGGIAPLIFARSEGENNPVDIAAGEKFSAANRRVEIEFSSMCPPLNDSKPLTDTPLRSTLPFKLNVGNF